MNALWPHKWGIHITLFKSITMLCVTHNTPWNIRHIQVECDEYSMEYCQSHKTLLWIWIMLCTMSKFEKQFKFECIVFIYRDYEYAQISKALNSNPSWPRARSHLHSVGPHPSHRSFTTQSSCRHLQGSLLRWEPMWQYPLFPSQLMEFCHMPKELNGISDRVSSH